MGRLPLGNVCNVFARVQRIATTDDDGALGRCEAGIALGSPDLHSTSTRIISDTCIIVHWHGICDGNNETGASELNQVIVRVPSWVAASIIPLGVEGSPRCLLAPECESYPAEAGHRGGVVHR
eukprot:2680250-Pyramimonas_sp.AAC.1